MKENDVIGKWTLVKEVRTRDRRKAFIAQCVCGKSKIVTERYLVSGKSTSCGCSKRFYAIGSKIGKFTVTAFENNKHAYYVLKCDCGNIKRLRYDTIKGLKNKSCGCDKIKVDKIYQQHQNRLYHIWYSMWTRCTIDTCKAFKNYGGRGISVCDEWKDFNIFCKWAESSGYASSLTIDRIDNNGNYCTKNCHWITKTENSRKTRATKLTMIQANIIRQKYNSGTRQVELCKEYNLSCSQIHRIVNNKRWIK
jgi:hypothetical protein